MKKRFVKVGNIFLPCKCLHYRRVTIRPKVGNEFKLYVPCGKCYACRKRAASDWAYRLGVESKRSSVYNILMTYADDKVPMHKGMMVLNRQHTVECIKRLRYYFYRYFDTKCKFFLCGEYSPEKRRPHYHALLFTDKPLTDVDKDLVEVNKIFENRCWRHGFANITSMRGSDCTEKLTSYMVTYMMTSLPSDLQDRSIRPFRSMSRNLGDNFPEVYPDVISDCHRRGEWTYKYQDSNGKEHERSYPRYYLKKYSTEYEADLRAEKYYQLSEEFYQYLQNLIQNERTNHRQGRRDPNGADYKSRLNTLKAREAEFEQESFRSRKIHKNNRQST